MTNYNKSYIEKRIFIRQLKFKKLEFLIWQKEKRNLNQQKERVKAKVKEKDNN